jgi:hypothetical protein
MIEICSDSYRDLAALLREEIQTADYFNGSVTLEKPDFSARLVATLIIYRRTETTPEGARRPIDNVVPVWWELQTTTPEGPVPNDFSFSELRPLLCDFD